MSSTVPDPKMGGGTYLFVANGNLEMQGQSLPRWSMVFVEPNEDAVEILAGPKGLEALIMQFPKDDD
jgi:redox-sensitive bicupin YhaK (pirin superfamily)